MSINKQIISFIKDIILNDENIIIKDDDGNKKYEQAVYSEILSSNELPIVPDDKDILFTIIKGSTALDQEKAVYSFLIVMSYYIGEYDNENENEKELDMGGILDNFMMRLMYHCITKTDAINEIPLTSQKLEDIGDIDGSYCEVMLTIPNNVLCSGGETNYIFKKKKFEWE